MTLDRPTACPTCDRENPLDARFCAGCGLRFGEGETTAEGADPLIGRTLADRYRIEELLGRGGMGVVYRVEHVRMGKLMAMKLLHGQLAREKDVVKRFKREAEAVSRLDHPNTVQVFDFGQSEGMTYLVMEYLSGSDLGDHIKANGPLPFSRVARVAAQVCGSVAQAHELGIIHRDLKPENVMMLADRSMPDFVKVLDFGLAKLRETEEAAEKSITRAGSILGTPYYMAPEHIRGEAIDGRSDVYAMGALMYKALTGVPPFWAPSPVGVLTMHLTEDLVPPSERAPELDIPPEADAIIARAMEKDADDRTGSMEALRQELLTYLTAVGEDQGLESGRVALSASSMATTKSGRQRRVATRGDVDRFERSIRRRSLLSYAVALLMVAGLAAGAYYTYVWQVGLPEETPNEELEPNNTLAQANALPAGLRMRAHLGRRVDARRSDADVYLLAGDARERRTVRVDVTAIPNMDLLVELYKDGVSEPLVSTNAGGVGQPESIANFPIEGSTHYLRVREVWEANTFPTENVSDAYEVRWTLVLPDVDDEREVNDSVERAQPLRVGERRRGFVGWGGDRDVYCLADDAPTLRAELEASEALDLVLTRHDRVTGRTTRLDEGGVGEDERSSVLRGAEADRVCFSVTASADSELQSDSDHAYVLRFVEAEP